MSEFLKRTVARSATLRERLSGRAFVPGYTTPQVAQFRLNEWQSLLGLAENRLLSRRMRLAGYAPGDEERAVREVQLSGETLREWGDALTFLVDSVSTHEHPFERWTDEVLPFEEILQPVARAAEAWIRPHAPLTEAAWRDLRVILLRSIASLSGKGLMHWLDRFRTSRGNAAESYAAFVASLRGDGWRDFLGEYSVLARILAMAFDRWLAHLRDFAQRLEADQPVHGELTSLRTPGGSFAEGSRTCFLLGFTEGKLVYKPRDVSCDAAFYELLRPLNDGQQFYVPHLRERDGYGWMEFLDHAPCQNPELYYRRAGHLAAVFDALGTTDAHCENVIAHGDWPVLVDAETAFGTGNVLDSGFLPESRAGKNGAVLDTSALGCTESQATGHTYQVLVDLNSDTMRLESMPKWTTAPVTNLPICHGQAVPWREFRDAIAAGYREMEYRLAPISPAQWEGLKVRCVVRPSYIYDFTLYKLRAARGMWDGVTWSMQLERLCLAFLDGDERLWPIFEEECRRLEQFEIPCFYARLGSPALLSAEGKVLLEDYMTPQDRRRVSWEEVRDALGSIE